MDTATPNQTPTEGQQGPATQPQTTPATLRRNPKHYRKDGTPYPSTGRHYRRQAAPAASTPTGQATAETPHTPDPSPARTPPTPEGAGPDPKDRANPAPDQWGRLQRGERESRGDPRGTREREGSVSTPPTTQPLPPTPALAPVSTPEHPNQLPQHPPAAASAPTDPTGGTTDSPGLSRAHTPALARSLVAQDRHRTMGRLLAEGVPLKQAYRQAGYSGKPSRRAHTVAAHPEVQAERARVVALAEAEAERRSVLTRVEALQVAARVARGETPAETVDHEGETPQGATRYHRTRIAPLEGVRAAADLEGWTQQAPGAQVAIQIVLGGRPADSAPGPRIRGDGVVCGTGADNPTLPVAAHGVTAIHRTSTNPLPDGHNPEPVAGDGMYVSSVEEDTTP